MDPLFLLPPFLGWDLLLFLDNFKLLITPLPLFLKLFFFPGQGSYWTLAPVVNGEKEKSVGKRKKKRRSSSVISERADDAGPTSACGRRKLSSSSSVSDAKMQPPTPTTSATSYAGLDVSTSSSAKLESMQLTAQHLAQLSAGTHGMIPSGAGTFSMMQPTANQMAALLQQVSAQGAPALTTQGSAQITQQQLAYLMQQQQQQLQLQQQQQQHLLSQHQQHARGEQQRQLSMHLLTGSGQHAPPGITASVASQLARAQSSQLIQESTAANQLPLPGTSIKAKSARPAGVAIPEHGAASTGGGLRGPNGTIFAAFQKFLSSTGGSSSSVPPDAAPIVGQQVTTSMGPPSSPFTPAQQAQPAPIVPESSRSLSASAASVGQASAGSNSTAPPSSGVPLPIDFLIPDISFDMLQAFLDNPGKDSQRATLLASFNAGQLGETRDLVKQCQEEFKTTSIGSLKASSFNDSTTFRNFSASFNKMLATAQPPTGRAYANDDEDENAFDWDSIT